MSYGEFFRRATISQSHHKGLDPLPYQQRLAEGLEWPARIEIPTGLGKTLAVVIAWLWRRRHASVAIRAATPRRLVYCLPMRVLVEQTRDVVADVLRRLNVSTRLVTLMGGVDDDNEWDTTPEDDIIVIGTQDMLLSRALNRGYGMSRYRWPLHFGLLNNDCLWVIDEVQLVGSGVATTAQLQALRRKLGTVLPTRTSWMSATLQEDWLRTVDVEDADLQGLLALTDADLIHPTVVKRREARKSIGPAASRMGDLRDLAAEVTAAHRAHTRTLVIVNTVERARNLFIEIGKGKQPATVVLLHSRFRAEERNRALQLALAAPGDAGTIVVSTQVIEAGVDLTSATLFTEVAPWASLVQRFGRCNRGGDDAGARVFWIALPEDDQDRTKVERPYSLTDLLDAQETLAALSDAGPASLPKKPLRLERGLVLRRHDLLDLFDTTPDLTGSDVDVSRFIRDTDDHDVRVCWRAFPAEPPQTDPSPVREELCAVPIVIVHEWKKARRAMWAWDGLKRRWSLVERLYPGLTLLLRSEDGGYDPVIGLDPKGTEAVAQVLVEKRPEEADREYDGEPESEWQSWYTLIRHSDDVAAEAETIASTLRLPRHFIVDVTTAGRWHDAGKAHPVWQAAAKRVGSDPPTDIVAKSNARTRRITFHDRPGFRHELASALLALLHGQSDLVCFLIASHHGKVRLSIRSLPMERPPKRDGREDPTIRHARGIWEGDLLPAVDLGGGLIVPATTLTLRYMDLGDDEITGPSWLSRMLALRDDPDLGPFRLAFLEGLVKCADERASRRTRDESGAP